MGKYIVIKNLKTLARINKTTKEIQVAPCFKKLDKKTQELILINLSYWVKTKNVYVADKMSIEKMIEKYPDVSLKEWKLILSEIFKDEALTEINLTRLKNISKYLKNYNKKTVE